MGKPDSPRPIVGVVWGGAILTTMPDSVPPHLKNPVVVVHVPPPLLKVSRKVS